jgi:pantothenate kinase type III
MLAAWAGIDRPKNLAGAAKAAGTTLAIAAGKLTALTIKRLVQRTPAAGIRICKSVDHAVAAAVSAAAIRTVNAAARLAVVLAAVNIRTGFCRENLRREKDGPG